MDVVRNFLTRYETKRLGDCDPVFLDFERIGSRSRQSSIGRRKAPAVPDREPHMTFETIYLYGVIATFAAFMGTLFGVSIWSQLRK